MDFISTRNAGRVVGGAQAVVKGLSDEGGLFVPALFPVFAKEEIAAMAELDYASRAALVIGKFLPELSELSSYTEKAYSRFDGDPAPVVKIDEGLFMLELWHGPTHAFKDVALTLLPYLLTGSKAVTGENSRTLILVATSGDTGKAALEGFRDVPGADVIVFYPSGGVSELQKLQMTTQKGDNVYVAAIEGNFDDAQTAVKKIFTDKEAETKLAKLGFKLSSANSMNFGRLVPQIAYYFSSYVDLAESGEIEYGDEVNFCVPSGNFGNILAGYYAKKMGLPVGRLICASNRNNVLTDFIGSGKYAARRKFYKTTSPSMDILVSSNLERLVFELSGRNDNLTAERMRSLLDTGTYSISAAELDEMKKTFWAAWASEKEVADTIADSFDEDGYIMDTHTAVARCVADKYYLENEDDRPVVVVSTASPYKFASDVYRAIGGKPSPDPFKTIELMEEETALPVPDSIAELKTLKKRFSDVIAPEDAEAAVIGYAEKAKRK